MARFKEVELKRQGCVSLVSRMYPDDTLFDYVVYVNANGKIHQVFGLKETDYWRNYGAENAKFHFADFEKKVLNPAIQEINELKACDMHILGCEKKKDGKYVLGYEIEYVFVNEEGFMK